MSSKQNPKKKKKAKKSKGDKTPQWCTCNMPSNEDMIACENPGCSIEWYHMECVGLDPYNVPEGDWFCKRCTDMARRKSVGSESHSKPKPKSKSSPPKRPLPEPVPVKPGPKVLPEKSSKPVFLCEWCESQFSSKQVCIEHKQECRKNAKHLSSKPSVSLSPGRSLTPEHRRSTSSSHLSPKRSRSRSPNSTSASGDYNSRVSEKSGANRGTEDGGKSEERGDTGNNSRSRNSSPATNPLAQFSSAQILACLEERGAAFSCECGVVFEDQTLYFLHRGCHNSSNPRTCSYCHYEAPDWYDFTTHFFQHKKSKQSPS